MISDLHSSSKYGSEKVSIIDCLREVSVDTLSREASQVEKDGLKDHVGGFSPLRPWAAVQDASSYTRRGEHGGFYYARPSTMLQHGNISKIPIMIGKLSCLSYKCSFG